MKLSELPVGGQFVFNDKTFTVADHTPGREAQGGLTRCTYQSMGEEQDVTLSSSIEITETPKPPPP